MFLVAARRQTSRVACCVDCAHDAAVETRATAGRCCMVVAVLPTLASPANLSAAHTPPSPRPCRVCRTIPVSLRGLRAAPAGSVVQDATCPSLPDAGAVAAPPVPQVAPPPGRRDGVGRTAGGMTAALLHPGMTAASGLHEARQLLAATHGCHSQRALRHHRDRPRHSRPQHQQRRTHGGSSHGQLWSPRLCVCGRAK